MISTSRDSGTFKLLTSALPVHHLHRTIHFVQGNSQYHWYPITDKVSNKKGAVEGDMERGLTTPKTHRATYVPTLSGFTAPQPNRGTTPDLTFTLAPG